jgi:hypothetical protein
MVDDQNDQLHRSDGHANPPSVWMRERCAVSPQDRADRLLEPLLTIVRPANSSMLGNHGRRL